MTKQDRTLAGVAAVALLALGVAAVFRTSNEAAATASLVIAAVFGLMAVTGLPIIGLEVTRDKIALQIGRIAERLATTQPEQAQELATQAAELARSSDRPAIRGVAYELAVLDALRREFPSASIRRHVRMPAMGSQGTEWDAMIEDGSKRFLVETKTAASERFLGRRIQDAIAQTLGVSGIDGLLIVVDSPRDPVGSPTLMGVPAVIVGWRIGDPSDTLAQALQLLKQL